jgi:hypothetical protein
MTQVYQKRRCQTPIRPGNNRSKDLQAPHVCGGVECRRALFLPPPARILICMKPPELFGDWRVVAGVVLMLLGTGNWLVGLNGIVQYRRLVVATSPSAELYRNFDELDARTDGAVLAPLTQDERTVSYAAAQMDFYHAVYLTGCILFALGLMISLMAFIGAIRRDSREAVNRRTRGHTPHSDDQTFGTTDARQNQPVPAHNRAPS